MSQYANVPREGQQLNSAKAGQNARLRHHDLEERE